MTLKLTYTILIASFLIAASAHAQTTPAVFGTRAYRDVNNIKAGHMVHGNMWWDPATGSADVEHPKGTGNGISYQRAPDKRLRQ